MIYKLLVGVLLLIGFVNVNAQNKYTNYWKAQTAFRYIKYDSAQYWAQLAEHEMPDNYRPIYLQAKIALARKDSSLAKQKFEIANSLEKGVSAMDLAQIAISQKQDSLAMIYLQALQTSKHRLTNSRLESIKKYAHLHRTAMWQEILENNNLSPEDRFIWRCESLIQAKEYMELDRVADSALMLTSWTSAHWYKACAWKSFGNAKIERKELLLALQKSPQNGVWQAALARNFVAKEEYGKAITAINTAIELFPDSIMLQYYRAKIFLLNNQYKESLADITSLLQIQPLNDSLWYMAGVIEAEQKHTLLALPYLNKAIELNPSQGEYFKCRGNTLFDSESFELAERSFSMALDVAPTDGTIYFNRALCRLRLQNKQRACYDFQRAAQLGIMAAQTYLPSTCQK